MAVRKHRILGALSQLPQAVLLASETVTPPAPIHILKKLILTNVQGETIF